MADKKKPAKPKTLPEAAPPATSAPPDVLSPEQEIAMLERRLAELKQPKPIEFPKMVQTKAGAVVVENAEQEAKVLAGEAELLVTKSAQGDRVEIKK